MLNLTAPVSSSHCRAPAAASASAGTTTAAAAAAVRRGVGRRRHRRRRRAWREPPQHAVKAQWLGKQLHRHTRRVAVIKAPAQQRIGFDSGGAWRQSKRDVAVRVAQAAAVGAAEPGGDQRRAHARIPGVAGARQLHGRVAATRAELEKKKAAVDAQLSNLVNTQIEESRYALELLTQSTKDIATTRHTFTEIDQFCAKVQSLVKSTQRGPGHPRCAISHPIHVFACV